MTLKDLGNATTQKKYLRSTVPAHARIQDKFSDSTANNLTKAILAFFALKDITAWRQASEGRYIKGREYEDMMGRKREEKGMYIPRNRDAVGIGDICAVIPPHGKMLTVEVKIGRDRQSDVQKKFQQEIEAVGGVYFIVHNWEEFWFQIKHQLYEPVD